ncbi:DEAD/DEAH box helicase family protein [Glaesserella parasuis]|uniref:DEAD/DEAH box helicase n=1 Tax=Glaesserella parasuis TaxID=738 RepID=UPI0004ED9A5B|nr:DEAD/DEAH box helicase family protein [Glaesserella parasuis]AIK90345.1 restriction endonuclease [Glaesserella parasuis]MDG6260003.1 DEAD/DEAH box helicase family protein [Glaesserella parasuis]MDG6266050.1 DEAD/DEAH box helicase family protein [Glaesserella parasuis]MDG6270606.1 DEAD/DEAH box helicase family protein [Glaesserella parasuis]MDG6274694.1 DEAD/DEAH box helicase family protein [Glaesserella parasuis]
MELNSYQTQVINDLNDYLSELNQYGSHKLKQAFSNYWVKKGVPNQQYVEKITNTPHVCVKVPTAGGKTFIAVNALQSIYSAVEFHGEIQPRFTVWLVPSTAILEQTIRNLRNPDHPYRQKLNVLFNGRVNVYEKDDVLLGRGFDADTVKSGISIVVMTFDAFRTRNKEGRLIYRENGYLASFDTKATALPDSDDTSLINVIRSLEPVVIVDESHNATSDLSLEMLTNLNAKFILDLTATPRKESNIISYVSSLALKKENMVKLPVNASNQASKEDVLISAVTFQHHLEQVAQKAFGNGEPYVRPIVLFQAEAKTKGDNTTFEKVKKILIEELNIPTEQIKIKTADIDELKNVDLFSPDCPVRFVITVNALKEGWDCSFAYILANLANKHSEIDVTQIVGRILRQPNAKPFSNPLLNMSYVFTASAQFRNVLGNIVEGLTLAGFSPKDYRVISNNSECNQEFASEFDNLPLTLPSQQNELTENESFDFDTDKLKENIQQSTIENAEINPISDKFIQDVVKQGESFNLEVQNSTVIVPNELKEKMNMVKLNNKFIASVENIRIPQFFETMNNGLFEDVVLFEKENLLTKFELKRCDTQISFSDLDPELYSVDIENEQNAKFTPLSKEKSEQLLQLFSNYSLESKKKSIVESLFNFSGKNAFYPIADSEIKIYFRRIVEQMSLADMENCLIKPAIYFDKIKQKIKQLQEDFAQEEFFKWIDQEHFQIKAEYQLPKEIYPKSFADSLSHNLYEKEAEMNDSEFKAISLLISLENIIWWHRIDEKRKDYSFRINGFINHYPDFLILTKKNALILLEIKGEHLANPESKRKLELGKKWESLANQIGLPHKFRYFMTFLREPMEGAKSLDELIETISKL